jgi:spore germination cell wall hydrolase CwlJ-like protein
MITPLDCLALAIYFESWGEPDLGQLAVGQVVINRVEDRQWPDDICSVVFQRGQFSFMWETKQFKEIDIRAWKKAEALADAIIQGRYYPITDATYYHSDSVVVYWGSPEHRRMQIGSHIFYRF